MLQIIFYSFLIALIIQFGYYILVFFKLAEYKRQIQPVASNEPVSVIIAAKNEEQNLQQNLPYILKQEYSNFEVIVIDDGSTDKTAKVLKAFVQNEKHLKIVSIAKSTGKKNAITEGIAIAQHEILLFTDADCKPKSPKWIEQMQSNFTGYTELVLGYGAMKKQSGILNKIIRFDTFLIALQYFSFALKGFPYMGVGRNMAYKKSLFTKNNGFKSHAHIQSGDDDLFVNEVSTKQNTAIEIRFPAHTNSDAKQTFKSWLIQKKRHLTTGNHYNATNKLLLGFYSLSQGVFWFSFLYFLYINELSTEVLVLFLSRMFLQLYVFSKTMDKLGEKDLLFLAPVFELLLIILNPLFLFSSYFSKEKWQ